MSFACTLALLASDAGAQASWDLAGTSLRDVAMAGAGAAGTWPGAAMQVDPAAVAAVQGELGALAWRGSFPRIDDSEGGSLVDGDVHAVDLAIAVARPLGDEVAVGAGFALILPLPDAVATEVHQRASDPQAPLLEDAADFTAFDSVLGAAWKGLSLGLGATIGMDLIAPTGIHLLSLTGDARPGGVDVSDALVIENDRELVWTAAPLVGARLSDGRWTGFLSWRGRTGFNTTGEQRVAVEVPLIDVEPVRVPVRYLSAWSPGRLTLGGGGTFGRVKPELTVRWLRSSTFADTQARRPAEPFHDVVTPAAGLEVDAGEGVRVRGGYALVPTPVPAQTGSTRFGDATRHVVGLGGALHLDDAPRGGDRTELGIAAQLQLLARRPEGYAARGRYLTLTAGVQTGF